MNKMNFSEMERFARRHVIETLTAIAIIIAALSAWAHFFVGGVGLSVIFIAIGGVVGVFFPNHIDRGIKKIYDMAHGRARSAEIVAEVIKILFALFLPFLYFGYLGLMAGTAYHYYIRHAQTTHRNDKAA